MALAAIPAPALTSTLAGRARAKRLRRRFGPGNPQSLCQTLPGLLLQATKRGRRAFEGPFAPSRDRARYPSFGRTLGADLSAKAASLLRLADWVFTIPATTDSA